MASIVKSILDLDCPVSEFAVVCTIALHRRSAHGVPGRRIRRA
jgi:hypothetical protein